MAKHGQTEKRMELDRLYEGENPFETEDELKDRISILEAELASETLRKPLGIQPQGFDSGAASNVLLP